MCLRHLPHKLVGSERIEGCSTLWLLKDSALFSLFLSILYLPAVHPQGQVDDAGVFSFIN
jgi:hypothetical protein